MIFSRGGTIANKKSPLWIPESCVPKPPPDPPKIDWQKVAERLALEVAATRREEGEPFRDREEHTHCSFSRLCSSKGCSVLKARKIVDSDSTASAMVQKILADCREYDVPGIRCYIGRYANG